MNTPFTDHEFAFLKQYGDDLQVYADQQFEQTLQLFESGDATGAIIEGRKLLDIAPNTYLVVERLGWVAANHTLRAKEGTTYQELYRRTLHPYGDAVKDTIRKARLAFVGCEVLEWQSAMDDSIKDDRHHSVAISALELADAFAQQSPTNTSFDGMLSSHTIAAENAKHYLQTLSRENSSLAEQSSIKSQYIAALGGIARAYISIPKLNKNQLAHAKETIYALDDMTRLDDPFLEAAYSSLLRSTSFLARNDRTFYGREVSSARKRIERSEFLKKNPRTYHIGDDGSHRPHPASRP